MKSFKVNLENCYGIGKFEHEFDFTNENISLIYAPNGTMKTSFSKTIDVLAKQNSELPKDRIFDKVSLYELSVDNTGFNHKQFLVINGEDNSFSGAEGITNFLASTNLKNKYDSIYDELNKQKSDLLKKLKKISKSSDFEIELVETFSTSDKDDFFTVLLSKKDLILDEFIHYDFKYNDIFDKKGKVKEFLLQNQQVLNVYIKNYKELLDKSKFFKNLDNSSFGTFQASQLLKSTQDDTYFKAGHSLKLLNGDEIDSNNNLKKLLGDEIDQIINNPELKNSFNEIDKKIGNNVELRTFKSTIEANNSILIELLEYESFRRKIILNYLSEPSIRNDILSLIDLYEDRRDTIQQIINDSQKELTLWTDIIDTFNSRFYVPFKAVLKNQSDVILKKQTATLKFEYKNINSEESNIEKEKEDLLKVLSKGEQRAFFIMQFLFEIESRKIQDKPTVIIFDDIAESFDYKNKYAVIEYISDLNKLNFFKMIILTHNFDFYRTLASRLNLKNQVFMAHKKQNNIIKLYRGQYRKNVVTHFLSKFDKKRIFISLIAFIRNIIEYTQEENSTDYMQLTKCLHIKDNSYNITASDIFHVYQQNIENLKDKTISFGDTKVIELIFLEATNIMDEAHSNEILLENKITLSIAIRLKAEEYMLNTLPKITHAIEGNQTRALFTEYKKANPSSANLELLDKVNLMTPENIHINAFMYEPLLDMSIVHLKDLFRQVTMLRATP